MKKFMLIMCIIAMSMVSSFAQVKVGTYETYGKEYDVKAIIGDNGKLSVYFNILGTRDSDDVEINLSSEDAVVEFRNSLNSLAEKYTEWRQVAIDNDVKDMTKDMPTKFPNVTIAWYGSKWYFDFGEKLSAIFMVMESSGEVRYSAVIGGEAQSSSNKYITQKYYIIFRSLDDILSLYKALDPEAIKEKLNGKKDKDDLFK